MATAKDVAAFFTLGGVSNLKLQKLVYYAQAWALARFGRPLFAEDLQAWEHGPVVPSIYREYAKYGYATIPAPESTDFLNNFTEEEAQLLLDVQREYAAMSAWMMRESSHRKDEPWYAVYHEIGKNAVIPKSMILDCFKEKESIPEATTAELFGNLPVVDSLPADWDDGEWNV